MIINHWGPLFTQLYGHAFPTSYLALDCEYTGGNERLDLIVEIGHCLVENGVLTDRLGIVLDWSRRPDLVPKDKLKHMLRRIELMMKDAGHTWRITYPVMQEEGIDPIKGLQFYYDLFRTIQKRKLFFAAHNGFKSDERMLQGAFEGFLLKEFRFGQNQLFDTGAIFKANLVLADPDPTLRHKYSWTPTASDVSLEDYFRRIVNLHAKGVFWNLEAAVKHYQLDQQYSLDMAQSHTAEFDAYMVHLLMEEYRQHLTAKGKDSLSPEGLGKIFAEELAASHAVRETKARRAEQDEEAFERRQGDTPPRRLTPMRRRGQRAV